MDGIRPNDFPEELNPTDTNFEVYSQRGGINKRATLSNLKKWFLAVVRGAVAYVPTPSGNASNRGEFITDPNGAVWYIDSAGAAIKLSGASSAQLYQDFGDVSGSIINAVITLLLAADSEPITLIITPE
jgi:hypothetical protein